MVATGWTQSHTLKQSTMNISPRYRPPTRQLSKAHQRRNEMEMRRIMASSKRVNDGVRKEREKAEEIMKGVMDYANARAYNDINKANKAVQEVIDYHK